MAIPTGTRFVSADLPAGGDGLAELARSLLEPRVEPLMELLEATAVGAARTDTTVTVSAAPLIALDVDEIIADARGEIVVDSGASELTLTTGATVVDSGIADAHVTELGDDVTGFAYVTLDSGLRLYFADDLHVTFETAG